MLLNKYSLSVLRFASTLLCLLCIGEKMGYAVDKNDENVIFLSSIDNLSSQYIQEEFDGKKIIKTSGDIAVKKPDSVMLTYKSDKMNLKFASINGNVKVIDQDLGQTTYVDNKYSDLMQFFTKNLKPERLKKAGKNILCMPFENFGNNFVACLSINLEKQTFNDIVVFVEDKDGKKTTNKKQKNVFPIMKITFKNLQINKGLNEEVFNVKDSRLFDEDDDF